MLELKQETDKQKAKEEEKRCSLIVRNGCFNDYVNYPNFVA